MSSEKIMAWLHENSTLSSKLRSATNYAATTLTKTYEGSLTTLIPPSPFFTEKICENCFAENSFSDNFLEPLYFPSFNLCCMLVQFTYNTTSGCHFWEKAFMIVLISQEKKLRVVIPFFKETCNYCQNKLQVKGGHHEKIAHFSGLYRITTTPQ